MKSGRRVLRVIAVIAIALAAGHVAQSGRGQATAQGASVMPLVFKPPQPVDGIIRVSAPADPELMPPSPAETGLPVLPDIASRPAHGGAALPDRPAGTDAASAPVPRDCTPLLALSPRPGAMIDILLSAPCRRGERVVLRHSDLAVTYRTNSAGALFATVPALVSEAQVSVLFAGGETVETRLSLPEAATLRRVGVQWMGPHSLSVAAMDSSVTGRAVPIKGAITALGDPTVEAPMLAQVYTLPPDSGPVSVLLEAAVTDASCGHDLLGDILTVEGGNVRRTDLSVTMPGCDAVGDYLVLKNLVPDPKLASN